MRIGYRTGERLTEEVLRTIKTAAREVFEHATFYKGDDIGFGVHAKVRTLSPKQMIHYPNSHAYLVAAFKRLLPFEDVGGENMLYFDIETHSADDRWNMSPESFFRLGQYGWGQDGEIVLTTDYDEMIEVIRSAPVVVGHNIHPFDLPVLFGKDSIEPLEMARDGRVFDTMVHANMVFPAPYEYVDRKGHRYKEADKPGQALKWFALDNLSYQLGLDGKVGDLGALAKKYGGYGNIPVDDPEYRDYARGDVVALRQVARALLTAQKSTPYDAREQLNAAIDAQNSRNGFTVDIGAATKRAETLAARKDALMVELQTNYGLPTIGVQPWRSKPGKEAILKALADNGITPESRPEWPILKTGPSLAGQLMIDLTAGTPAQAMGESLAELMGQRSLPRLALDCTQNDGKVHPEITALQRSGRKSTTKPALTIWGAREGRDIDKDYFVASPGRKIVTFDYSQADARIVAAYSGDEAFKERFAEGVDAHELTGRLVFDDYDDRPVELRQVAKALGHAYAYRAAAKKLALTSKQPFEVADKFVKGMQAAYPKVTEWQNKVTDEGYSGWVTNDWGRRIVIEPNRSFTQSPAMYGQSGTRELMVDALIRMLHYDIRIITWLVGQIHDELVFDIPDEELGMIPKIKELMETTWGPSDGSGQVIDFPVGIGGPARTWKEAGH